MKQLLILSGKGGTGKTTVASALIKLSQAKAFADCDVDAPNLHLILKSETEPERQDYFGMEKAFIEADKCKACGLCMDTCNFDAISKIGDNYKVDLYACEGCGVCEMVCPNKAISLKPDKAGKMMLYKDEASVFSTAQLKMGRGTSGKLVSEVKKQLRESVSDDVEYAIIDGSPGIGCPVIASMSGADMVLIVAEPSVSGISDMKRILKTAEKFSTDTMVCVNKYDTNLKLTAEIEDYCRKNNILFLAGIPFDKEAIRAVNEGLTIVDVDCISGDAIHKIYNQIFELYLS